MPKISQNNGFKKTSLKVIKNMVSKYVPQRYQNYKFQKICVNVIKIMGFKKCDLKVIEIMVSTNVRLSISNFSLIICILL